jgi:hypothetical protein
VAFGRYYGLLLSFSCHWSSFRLFGLIILGDLPSHMMTSLPSVD